MANPDQARAPIFNAMKIGFLKETLLLSIDQIIATKIVSPATRASRKYQQIVSSIEEVGIIEPPVVAADKHEPQRFILLDGHLRVEALKQIGKTEVICLVSTDDEAFTYNKHINGLSIIQEHRMILMAIDRGVPEAIIAKALDLDVASIVRKKNLLDGICTEVTEMLKDKMVAVKVFHILKKMKPMRQIETVTLMNDARVYSTAYANALFAATPRNQLVDPAKPKNIKGYDPDQMIRMETELENLQGQYSLVEETFREDMMNLMLAKGYLGKLLGNVRVVRYLAQNQPEMLSQFQNIAEMRSLSVVEAAE